MSRLFTKAIALSCAVFWSGAAAADMRIGLAGPMSGSFELLGRQLRDGVSVATRTEDVTLLTVDDRCDAEGGAAAARSLIDGEVEIVVGFLCMEALEAALPLLRDAGIPVITPGVRADRLTDLREKNGWLVWRIAPRADAEAQALSDLLLRQWRNELFAIVDDGTIYGRDLSETLRLAAELVGLTPVFVDTYRPQSENQIGLVGRLNRAGATQVFVGGDREDVAIIARDAAALGYEFGLAGGEALRAPGETPLRDGVLMVGLPEWADTASTGEKAVFAEAGIAPEGYVVSGHAAAEIAMQALERAEQTGTSLQEVLSVGAFSTLTGPVSFDAKGDLSQNPFRLLRHDGDRFVLVEE